MMMMMMMNKDRKYGITTDDCSNADLSDHNSIIHKLLLQQLYYVGDHNIYSMINIQNDVDEYDNNKDSQRAGTITSC